MSEAELLELLELGNKYAAMHEAWDGPKLDPDKGKADALYEAQQAFLAKMRVLYCRQIAKL